MPRTPGRAVQPLHASELKMMPARHYAAARAAVTAFCGRGLRSSFIHRDEYREAFLSLFRHAADKS